jgi:hypothetical protein
MPKLTYTPEKGLVQEAGSGVVFQTDTVSFTSLPFTPVQAITAAATVTSPGVYTISGSAALPVVMPLAATHPGGTFIFRTVSAQAHYLTGSAEATGTPVFAGQAGATPAGVGSKLNFPAIEGSSVVLVSDGRRFCITAGSGSMSLSESIPA